MGGFTLIDFKAQYKAMLIKTACFICKRIDMDFKKEKNRVAVLKMWSNIVLKLFL